MSVEFYIICGHEAAHAVIAFLCSQPATRLTANENGGLRAGTGKMVFNRYYLQMLLAGIAYETGYGLWRVNLKHCVFDDVVRSREIIRFEIACERRKATARNVESRLQRHLAAVCRKLAPFSDEIEELGGMLEETGDISPRRVASFMRWRVRPVEMQLRNPG